MILIYCYSTYKFSPVGFEIGSILLPIKNITEYTELKKCQDTFVRKSFEKGYIKKIYGKNPVNGHYLFMAKKLRCDFINEDNMPAYKISSFLFEFDNVDEYKRFVKNYDKAKLESAMNDFIIPDSFAETFALKIHTTKLNEYITSVLSSDITSNVKPVEVKDLYFELVDDDPKAVQEISSYLGAKVSKVDRLRLSTKNQNFIQSTLFPIIRVVKYPIQAVVTGGTTLITVLKQGIMRLIHLLEVFFHQK